MRVTSFRWCLPLEIVRGDEFTCDIRDDQQVFLEFGKEVYLTHLEGYRRMFQRIDQRLLRVDVDDGDVLFERRTQVFNQACGKPFEVLKLPRATRKDEGTGGLLH